MRFDIYPIPEFNFDPKKGVPASAVQALDMKYFQSKLKFQSILKDGLNDLRQKNNTTNAEIGRLNEHIAQIELQGWQCESTVLIDDIDFCLSNSVQTDCDCVRG